MDSKLIQRLNEETEYEYNFKIKSARLDTATSGCLIEIFYKDGIILSKVEREKVQNLALDILPKKYNYDIKFIKNFVSEERVAEVFDDVAKFVLPSVPCRLNTITKENDIFKISVIVDEGSFERAKSKKLDELIADEYKKRFSDSSFSCELDCGNINFETQDYVEKKTFNDNSTDFLSPRFFDVTEKEIYIGEEIPTDSAKYIMDKAHYLGEVVFAGKVKAKKELVFVSKKKDEDKKENKPKADSSETSEEKEEKKPRERHLFKFMLEDFTGSISCTIFATKQTQEKLTVLSDDQMVIVRGNLEMDSFSNELALKVLDISFCKLPDTFEEKIVYHSEKPFYEFAKPEKYVAYEQNNLMNFTDTSATCPHLAGKTYVCYDLETTGVSYEAGDRIIEIGAYKIVDGKITERFVSFVNPERPIPEKASAVNHIYDKDVATAPKDFEVLGDFYKFTRGAILVGYNNISFDDVFLVGQGKACRWNFDNESEDAYILSQKYVHDIKNHKLITVAKALGVTLDNAHSAGWDALATAEVFIKLAQNLEN